MENKTIEDGKTIVSVLNDDEQQLLKDTIIFGGWGDGTGDMLFIRDEYYEAFEKWARL